MIDFRKHIYKLTIPSEDEIDCEKEISADGSEGVYYTEINIGTGIGDVIITYNAQAVPDRFILEYDGNVVADSKYVGSYLTGNPPDYNGMVGTEFTGLRKYVYNPTTEDYEDQGSEPNVIVQQSEVAPYGQTYPWGELKFSKTTSYPTTALLKVIGVFEATRWTVETYCPTPPFTAVTEVITGYSTISGSGACGNLSSTSLIRYIPTGTTFENTTVIYKNTGGVKTGSGYYSDGTVWHEWDGNSIINTGNCSP